ncbi:OB-fold nucleic acid binding domain-containing protein, partial [Actinocorallia lasiicapitis]
AGALAGTRPGHLPGTAPGATAPALPPLTVQEETLSDLWSTGVSATHPMAHVRPLLADQGVIPAERLREVPADTNVQVAGLVTHRQRPPTAGGIVFLSLEDETGTSNVICPPAVWSRHRAIGLNSQALVIHGRLESRENVLHVHATKLSRLPVPGRTKSRNFH